VFWFGIAIYTIGWGRKCPANPWGEGADTLEWTLPSPVPFHQFEIQPTVYDNPQDEHDLKV
jgi:cytochrome c oxidase subunit 1